jgi:hypothetical protein
VAPAVRRPGRASRAAGAAALVAAVASATTALVIAGSDASPALEASPATAAVPPPTIEAVRPPGPASPTTVAPASTTTTTSTTPATTLPLSPLHALLDEPRPAAAAASAADVPPVAISIDAIDVRTVPVRDVGILPDGELEIPGADEVGWYRLGAAPGQPGSTVLAAHVSWNRRSGPFLRLAELAPGASVVVSLADGSTRRYEVVARAQHDKRALPAEIWRTSGPETLVLITCGGAFDAERRRYADNIVVTAVPVG